MLAYYESELRNTGPNANRHHMANTISVISTNSAPPLGLVSQNRLTK